MIILFSILALLFIANGVRLQRMLVDWPSMLNRTDARQELIEANMQHDFWSYISILMGAWMILGAVLWQWAD